MRSEAVSTQTTHPAAALTLLYESYPVQTLPLRNILVRLSPQRCKLFICFPQATAPSPRKDMTLPRPKHPQAYVNPSKQQRKPPSGVRPFLEQTAYQEHSQRRQKKGCDELDDVAAGDGHGASLFARSWVNGETVAAER